LESGVCLGEGFEVGVCLDLVWARAVAGLSVLSEVCLRLALLFGFFAGFFVHLGFLCAYYKFTIIRKTFYFLP
ncbi:hypothetical protein RAE01_21280, partial [Bacillus velezensis]